MNCQILSFWGRTAKAAVLTLSLGLIAHTATAATNFVQNPYFAITGGSDATSLQFGTGLWDQLQWSWKCGGLGLHRLQFRLPAQHR